MPSIASGLTSDGVIIGVKPYFDRLRHRHVHQRELQQRADAGQVVAAARRRPWRRARGRWRRAARPSSTWSRGSKPSAAKSRGVPTVSSSDEVVLAALGHAVARPGCDSASCRRRSLRVGLVLLGFGGLHLVGELLGLLQQRGLLLARGLAGSACRAASARCAGSSKRETADAAPLVGGQQRVDEGRIFASGALRGADTVRVCRAGVEGQSWTKASRSGWPRRNALMDVPSWNQ